MTNFIYSMVLLAVWTSATQAKTVNFTANLQDVAPIQEPLVSVKSGRLEDFIGKQRALATMDAIISDDTSYLTGFELPIDLSTFSADDRAAMQSVVTNHDGQNWLPILASTYNTFLTPKARQEVTEFALKIFNKLMPPVYPKIDVYEQGDNLASVFYLSQVRPDYQSLGWSGPVGVENLFSDHAVENLFQLPNVQSPTGYLNCASNTYASLLAGADSTTARYVSMNSLDPLFQQYFTEVQPPLQMGDVVRFFIPGNFHVFVYAGTDAKTGERIGFTKNGKELGIFEFMRMDDIYNLYQSFTITDIKYYRLSKPMPANLFDQFPAVTSLPESFHDANRAVMLPKVKQIISEELRPSDIPVLRGNY